MMMIIIIMIMILLLLLLVVVVLNIFTVCFFVCYDYVLFRALVLKVGAFSFECIIILLIYCINCRKALFTRK